MSDELGCILCLKKYPGRKFWQLATLKIVCMGFGIEGQICPDCQKKIPHHGVTQTEAAWKALRDQLRNP